MKFSTPQTILIVTLSILLFQSSSSAQNQGVLKDHAFSIDSSHSIPACESSSSDSDGDGWGWENFKSCKVGGEVEYVIHPICNDANSDSDGDSWGWENGNSCQVEYSETDQLEPEIDSANSSDRSSEDSSTEDFSENELVSDALENQVEPVNSNCRKDRINSLLSSKDRIGFGRHTTGGRDAKHFTVVTNTNSEGPGSLREAILKRETDSDRSEPKWVIFDQRLDGKTIFLERAISTFQSNLTIDGRGENGMLDITISPSPNAGNIAVLQFRGGNTILHGFTVDGRSQVSTAIMPRQGHNYWIDHLTITGFKSDDSLSFGQAGKSDSSSKITVSNYRAYNTSKSIQSGGNSKHPDYPLHEGTILNSDLGAYERNPRITFGGKWHMFNNYVHSFGGNSGIDINNGAQMIAENNVVSALEARGATAGIAGRRGPGTLSNGDLLPTGHVYSNGNILLDGAGESGSINPSRPSAFNIPYKYSLMSASKVVSHVKNNAGAENASGSLLYCN